MVEVHTQLLRGAGNCLLMVAKGIRAVVRARGQLLEPGGAWVIERLLWACKQLLRVCGLDPRDAWGA